MLVQRLFPVDELFAEFAIHLCICLVHRLDLNEMLIVERLATIVLLKLVIDVLKKELVENLGYLRHNQRQAPSEHIHVARQDVGVLGPLELLDCQA